MKCETTPLIVQDEPINRPENITFANVICVIIWTMLFICIGYPVAAFCANIWVFLVFFEPLLPFLKPITDFLLRLTMWPKKLGRAVVELDTSVPVP